MHPNDPPVPLFRGVAQPLADLASMKRLVDVVDSPSNSVFFDTGVTTEWGEDAVEVIGYFGGRDLLGRLYAGAEEGLLILTAPGHATEGHAGRGAVEASALVCDPSLVPNRPTSPASASRRSCRRSSPSPR